MKLPEEAGPEDAHLTSMVSLGTASWMLEHELINTNHVRRL